MSFPKQLNLEQYFSCPIWWADEPKFVKKYSSIRKVIEKSVKNYCIDIKSKRFPSSKNVYRF